MSELLYSFSAVRCAVPYAYDIQEPTVRGSLNSVFIASSIDGKYVCKFNQKDLAQKNLIVSEVFNNAGIRVPNMKIMNYGNTWVEVYPFIKGHTMYELIGKGMSGIEVQSLYREIVDEFAKMDQIDYNIINTDQKYAHQVAKSTISAANNIVVGTLFSGAVRLMNCGNKADLGLYHCGITPKNVIVKENGKLAGFVDLDEISVADKNYAFGMMAGKYQQLGFDPAELIEQYEQKTNKKLNHKKIHQIANLTNIGKYLLWRGSKNKNTR